MPALPEPSGAADIAVIGLSGRFPGARTAGALWENVRNGVESIARLDDEALRRAGVCEEWLRDPSYVKASAGLDDVDRFDAGFFGFSPREAAILDPQHRHFLECAWEALEDAGHPPEAAPGPVGVFAGCGMNAYFTYHLATNAELVRSAGIFLIRHTGNDKDFLTTRLSYLLDLRGPSVAVQTACSTSLVAIHLACQHLLSYQCDLALAGGVTIELPDGVGYRYEPGEILSPDGHCRPFAAEAQGTVFGSGVGVVVLRRLADALADGDQVLAVVKGSAVNNDGAGKVGYLAPSVDGQAAAVHEALEVAGVDASTVGFLEAHGTGTPVGDPIEVAALTQAFRRHTDRRGFCALGSLKASIGHLDTAAGVASFIKAVLALRHREIPPALHAATPNPRLELDSTPFVLPTSVRPWPAGEHPRRAGVNSLGVGGTNAHVILEEAPARLPLDVGRPWQVLPLSHRTRDGLVEASQRLAKALEQTGEPLADVAYTLQVGRRAFNCRHAVVCRTAGDAARTLGEGARTLSRSDARAVRERRDSDGAPPVVLLFPGGGAQFPGMGAELYRHEPVFREAVETCLATGERLALPDIRPWLLPAGSGGHERAAAELQQPSRSIYAVFVVGYALAKLWESWGIRAAALAGHSLGEYVAAHLAGVFSLDDALRIVGLRGRIFDRLPKGAMLSVALAEDALRARLPAGIDVAAVNAPQLTVAAGPAEAIARLARALAGDGIDQTRLHIDVAAHSSMLDPWLDEFERGLAGVAFSAPTLPLASNLTGGWAGPDVASPEYWRRHLRGTVRFGDALSRVIRDMASAVLVEAGPGQTLTSLARAQAAGPDVAAVASMRHARDTAADHEVIYGAVAELWTRGVAIDWVALHGGPRRRVSLPTYPFERARHWIDAPLPPFASGRWPADGMEAPAGHHPTDDWCYEPAWEPLEATTPRRPCGERWLLLVDEPHAGHAAVARELTARGAEVRRVVAGDSFQVEHGCIRIRPGRRDDAEALLRHCASSGFVPTDVAHAWLMRPPPACGEPIDTIGDGYPRGFATLVALLQAQGAIGGAPWRLTVLTTGLPGASTDGWQVDAALLLGPVLAGPGEYPGLRARLIDGSADEQSAAALVDETLRERQAARVAVEGGVTRAPRLVRRRPMAPAPDTVAPLTSDAVCLITGGLGGLGSALATRLADTVRPCLVLVGRSPLPPREAWDGVLADAPGSVVASLVRRLRELESRGAKVTYYEADVADAAAVGRLVERVRVEVGRIDAIFHAAGVVDDGVIQMKTPDRAQRVVAVKAVGAAALDAATSTDPPGLFVLFSSTSAFLGLAGQADYTSANAYLDAFAHWRAATRPGRTLAVNWGMWKEVGLAARAAGIEAATGGPPAGATHPLLGHATTRSPQLVVFESSVRADDRWELDEHRLADGTAVLPGAAFIDLLWSAAVRTLDRTAIELAHVVFVAPLAAPNGGLQRIRTTLRCRGDSWDAVIESRGAGANGWRPHVRAEVLAGAKPWRDDAITSLAELWAGSSPSSDFDERGLNPRQAAHVRFGPRWHSVRRAARHEGSMVAELELTEALQGDLELPRIHPALFDMATTVALPLVEGGEGADGPFAPFSFGRVRLEGPLPSRLIVSSSVAAHVHQKADTATFDVRMFDAEGRLVARAEEFVMRRLARLQAAADFGADAEGPEAARLRRWVERGIGTKDGLDLLARLVEAPSPVQVVVSSIPPDELEREARPDAPRERSDSPVLAPTAPADIERVVAELWSELLGVERVDADDDFFELGGHSLIALRLASRLEKRLGARLTLSTLFEARTVRELSAALAAAVAPRWTALAPIQTTGGRRPFFCVHAVGGEVLAYRELARALGADQPFYGFRSRGHDGHRAPLATIEEQAALYVEELVAFDPQGPYCLGGYSHGARVAFEMAQQLRRAGRDVAFLAIIDTWPRQRFPREWRFLGAWLRNLPRWIRHELLASPAAHNLDRAARGWRRLARAVRSKASGRPHDPDVNDEMNVSHLPDHVRRTIRANFRAFVRYRPAGYDGDLVLLRAHAQPLASPASDDLDWRTFVSGRLRVRHVPGNHTSILRPPAVDVLARALREELDRALDERAAGGGQRPALAG